MARTTKQGIDYFPLDVDFLSDFKVRKIMRACGPSAPGILISLLSNIYRDHGYFVRWDNDLPFLIAEEVGVSEGAVIEVMKKALQVGLFEPELYEKHKILTSRGIQKRFLKITERRKQIEMVQEYCLMETATLPVNIYGIDAGSNPLMGSEIRQRKENKREAKQKKQPGEARVYDKEGIPYKCAQYLSAKILAVNPNARVPKEDSDLFKWCVPIDRLLNLDKKPPDELREVLAFAVKDPFWSTQVLSTKTFREKYDQLYAKMRRTQNEAERPQRQPAANPVKKNRFCNFPPRTQDFTALEKEERAYIVQESAEQKGIPRRGLGWSDP